MPVRFFVRVALGTMTPLLLACVGPTTPFGAIDTFEPPKELDTFLVLPSVPGPVGHSLSDPVIQFLPDKQVLHDRADFIVKVTDRDSIADNIDVKMIHNNNDVTDRFLSQSRIVRSSDKKSIHFVFGDLRLKTEDSNEIEFVYKKKGGGQVVAKYLPPTCSMFSSRSLASIEGFRPPEDYIEIITQSAKKQNYNPGYVAGIVAQESGFNPLAVSWAKAIGLTQITSLAEEEIIKDHADWPRYPGIDKMGYISLRRKIASGQITPEKEWRLNPKFSIEGGVSYLNYLRNYWMMPEHEEILRSLDGELGLNMSRVILASYNSGAARVKAAILQKKNRWAEHKKLKEANKYVKKVSSYCYHFSKDEVPSHDSET